MNRAQHIPSGDYYTKPVCSYSEKKKAIAMLRAMGRRGFERALDTNLHLA